MRVTITLLLIFLLAACGKRVHIGSLEYYHFTPRIPSVPDLSKKYNLDAFTSIWGVLGTIESNGPIFQPIAIKIAGVKYSVSNWKYKCNDHQYVYIFNVSGPTPDGFPYDLRTGNLFSEDPDKRQRKEIEIYYIRTHDQKKFTGIGTIEQSTILQMNAVNEFIEKK